jgi:NAD(P)-dependent dehydrogenase (short-subunit alcohol dehydrogenase family)
MKEMDMQGKVALITGGGSGIGRAACLEFARAGASVVVVDIDAEAAEKTASEVRALGVKALSVNADVSQSVQVQAYVQQTMGTLGRIDFFFNNAGTEGRVAPLAEYDEVVWDRVIGVNLKGVFLGLRYVLPVMIVQQKGAIVNTASVAGTLGAPTLAAYSASKHGIIGLTRTAAGEVGKQGIRVNAICPGPIDTRMVRSIAEMINPEDPGAVAKFNVGRNPMGRYGEAAEVARVVVFLCSDAAAYVNGAAWVIDGGRAAI